MYKRFSVLFFLVLTLFSSGFSLLEFSPQNVTLTSYDENTGVGQLDFDITYNGSEEIYLTINTKGLLVDNFFAIENVMNGSSLKHISHNFDISQFGNYTQEYYISVTVDDLTSTAFPVTVIGEREIQSLKVNYLGGTEVPSLKKVFRNYCKRFIYCVRYFNKCYRLIIS